MKTSEFFAALALSAGMLISGDASAAFSGGTYCSASTLLDNGDVKLNSQSATDCYGTVSFGGDVESEIDNINALGWGTDYSGSNYLKDDGAGSATADFLGFTWTLAATNGSNNSIYTLSLYDLNGIANPNLPLTLDIVAFLKAADEGAFYYFDDALVDATNTGTFEIKWTVGDNGSNPDLSGMSLFIGDFTQVPEPGSLALLGLALAGLSFAGRLRRA